MAGIQVIHIPYKGGAPALADLVGGQIQFMLENIPGTLPFARSGKLRALAVTDLKRSPLLPELPTLDESGLKGYQIVGWNGLFVPAGTPQAVVNKLHAEVVKALAASDVKQRARGHGCRRRRRYATALCGFHQSRDSQVGEGGQGRGAQG